ncbi:MAG: 50S ribosomal protein L22 [Candidatus Magasanikbacteria bacterium]|nr:50S ribosomal protein L22 [Candidatus Magasanikbacteria bacterium]
MISVTAKLRYYRMGPRKMRLLADVIRGRDVARAESALSVLNKKGSPVLIKLLRSAVANAKNNHNLDTNLLRVASLTVDGGPSLKRWLPRAHGRATPIRERTCHVTLTLAPFEKKTKVKVKKDNKIS